MEQSVSGIGVLDKAISIIRVVADNPANLAELVELTELSRPTAFRLAKGLISHGFLRYDEDGRFTLGSSLIPLGAAASDRFPLDKIAEPILKDLRDTTGESVQLYVRDGDSRLCLSALDSLNELRTIVAPGARLPLGQGSAGRVLSGEKLSAGGWIATVEEREKGVASVSAPVFGFGSELIASVSVSGPIGRFGRSPGAVHGPSVVDAAKQIGKSAQAV